MRDVLVSVLNMTAWRMETPELFGSFHIAASLAAAVIAVLAAYALTRNRDVKVASILETFGWILLITEVWKQLFLYFIVNGGTYDWWFFPFQLCSVPMYLCILLAFTGSRAHTTFMTFMCGYTFVSAVATLIYPEDILRSYIALTVHGFVWHGILLFISLLIAFSGKADASVKGLAKAAVLFAVLCGIAVLINVLVEPVMQASTGLPHSWAAMFYLNPYHISPQPIVSAIQKTAGIPAGLVLYALVIAIVSSLTCRLLQHTASPGLRRDTNK